MSRRLVRQSHVVVTDPIPEDYRDLNRLAGEQGWHIHFFTSGAAAVQFARSGHRALWLVNVRLPDMSGFDLVELLRDEARESSVFAVANGYRASDEQQACQRGADLFLCKDATRSLDVRPTLEPLVERPSVSARSSPIHGGPGP